jgi:hypothetical protein
MRLPSALEVVDCSAFVDGAVEEVDVPRERVLVHGVDVAQSRDEKKRMRDVRRRRAGSPRASSIFCVGASAIACFCAISFESALAREMTSMAVSVVEDVALATGEHLQNLVLNLLSCFLLSAASRMRRDFSSSSSGRSLATTMPRSWSSSPFWVIIKLSSVTRTDTSGK